MIFDALSLISTDISSFGKISLNFPYAATLIIILVFKKLSRKDKHETKKTNFINDSKKALIYRSKVSEKMQISN